MPTNVRFTRTNNNFFIGVALFGLTCFAAWATHVVWIIRVLASDKGATFGQMALGAIGAFMPPVGIIHGFLMWLGLA